ncbi:unnamed protein product, partial [marine sediment metagenome]
MGLLEDISDTVSGFVDTVSGAVSGAVSGDIPSIAGYTAPSWDPIVDLSGVNLSGLEDI